MPLSCGVAWDRMLRIAAAAAAGLGPKAGVALRRRAAFRGRSVSTPPGVWIPVTGRALETEAYSRAAAGCYIGAVNV